MSRTYFQRVRLMGELPDELFERLMAAGFLSAKALANIAMAVKRNDPHQSGNIERCPHCGGALRERYHIPKKAMAVIRGWVATLPPEARDE